VKFHPLYINIKILGGIKMSIKNVSRENENMLGKKIIVVGLYDAVNFNPIDTKPEGSYIIDIRRNTEAGIFGTVVHHESDTVYDVLEDLVSIIKAIPKEKLSFNMPRRTVYVLNGKSKGIIISLIEDLKEKCPVAFSDELAKQYDQVLNLLRGANTLFANNEEMTSNEATRRINIIFNSVDKENLAKPKEEIKEGGKFMEDKFFTPPVTKEEKPVFADARTKEGVFIPDDVNPKKTFRAGMILANIIHVTDVVDGEYCGNMRMPVYKYLKGVLKDDHSGRPLVLCNDDATRLYREFVKRGERDIHGKLLYTKEFGKFLANVIPVDEKEILIDIGDDGWDDVMLAEKWSGIKAPEKKKNAVIITANNKLGNHLNVLNTNKAIELFGIDTNKVAVNSLMSLLPNVTTKIEEMQGLYNIAKYIDDNAIDIIYIDTITINPDNTEFWDRIVELGKILKLCANKHVKYIGADKKEYIFPAK